MGWRSPQRRSSKLLLTKFPTTKSERKRSLKIEDLWKVFNCVSNIAVHCFFFGLLLNSMEYLDFSKSDGRDKEAAVNVSRHDAHTQVCHKGKNSFLAKFTSSESVIYESYFRLKKKELYVELLHPTKLQELVKIGSPNCYYHHHQDHHHHRPHYHPHGQGGGEGWRRG